MLAGPRENLSQAFLARFLPSCSQEHEPGPDKAQALTDSCALGLTLRRLGFWEGRWGPPAVGGAADTRPARPPPVSSFHKSGPFGSLSVSGTDMGLRQEQRPWWTPEKQGYLHPVPDQ